MAGPCGILCIASHCFPNRQLPTPILHIPIAEIYQHRFYTFSLQKSVHVSALSYIFLKNKGNLLNPCFCKVILVYEKNKIHNNQRKDFLIMKIKRYVAAAMAAGVLSTVSLATGITALAATGWIQNGNSYVYYDDNGSLHKGWIQTNDGYYYMDLSTGVMTTGLKKINDKLYYFGSNGIMQTGLIHDAASDKYYYGQSDGTLVIGWLNLDGSYYHMDEDGSLGTGWKTISGSRYYFDPASGKCALNIAMPIDGNWFLFGEDGKMQTGFHNVNGATYYFDPSNGVMVAGTTKTISGVSYTFNADGTCTTTLSGIPSHTTGTESSNNSQQSSQESTADAENGRQNVIVAGSSRS
ncbi:hypothetical protein DW922_03405 [Clostridium sp. AM42-4]|nr:hypothetical protein DW922_03405 [Clostridium sp. AM42-4]